MRNSEYSSVDSKTGDITYKGPLEITKGNHNNMPARTEAYLPGDERGHINASSLSGDNSKANIAPQHADLNHGSWLSIENGERSALKNGVEIQSEKTAVINSSPGDRPTSFVVSDTVKYADGHVETIHHSFVNEAFVDQAAWNDMSASLPDTFDGTNPGDGLRPQFDTNSYATLMETTDAQLPSLSAEYAPADYAGPPVSAESSSNTSTSISVAIGGESANVGANAGAIAGK